MTGELIDRRQGLRIVRGELREHRVARGEQLAGAGDIGDVSVQLARVDREIGEAAFLCALDLGVPVGALDQAHHDPAAGASRQVDDPVDHEGAALAIGLDDEAQPVPAGELEVQRQAFKQVEG